MIDLRSFTNPDKPHSGEVVSARVDRRDWVLAADGHCLMAVQVPLGASRHPPWLCAALGRSDPKVADTFESLLRQPRHYRVPLADLKQWSRKSLDDHGEILDVDPRLLGHVGVNRKLVHRCVSELGEHEENCRIARYLNDKSGFVTSGGFACGPRILELGVGGTLDAITILNAEHFIAIMPWQIAGFEHHDPFALAPYFCAAAAGFE